MCLPVGMLKLFMAMVAFTVTVLQEILSLRNVAPPPQQSVGSSLGRDTCVLKQDT